MLPAVLAAALFLAPIGALPERRTDEAPASFHFTSVRPEHLRECPTPGTVCFLQAPGSTLRASVLEGAGGKTPIFFRALPGVKPGHDVPWDLLLVINLKTRTVPGPLLVAVFDADDKAAIANHEVTQLWTLEVSAFKFLAAFVHLDPSEGGFNPTHTYLFRVVQLLGKREVVLAEGKVRFD